MSDIQNHPDIDQLLQLVDEGAPSKSNRPVRRHVATCWKCRSHLDELQETVREFARYHEKVLLPNLPAPPHPWSDLRPMMRQFDEANPLPDLWTRACAYLALPAVVSLKRLVVGGIAFSCVALAVTLAWRSGKPVRPAPAAESPVTNAPAPPKSSSTTPAPVAKTVPGIRPTLDTQTVDTEVQVFAALHRIGADLGDPIEVASDSKGTLKVIGIGLASARQAEVRDALASLPDVALDFSHATPAGGPHQSTAQSTTRLSFEAGRSPFEARLQQALGGQVAWERYTNQVLDESDTVLVRAHALHTLAEHFPAARRAALTEPERTLLDQMIGEHRAALAEHARNLESLAAPVRDALSAPPLTAAPAGNDPLMAAQRMDRVLSAILGVASTSLTPSQLIAELSQASAELQAASGSHE